MAISRSTATYLIEEAARRPFSGRLLTLGIQSVFLTEQAFERIAAEAGVSLRQRQDGVADAPENDISPDVFFGRLGFDAIVATDVNDYEDAALIFDLNDPAVPSDHAGQYDMVLDGGTLEHVFHLPNALKNIVDFTAIGGRIVHIGPSSNHLDHGFFMFSPTLFADFYTANGLTILTQHLFRYNPRLPIDAPYLYWQYQPGALLSVSGGGLGPGAFGNAVIAQKTDPVTEMRIPQQRMYLDIWDDDTAIIHGVTVAPKKVSLDRRIRNWLLDRLGPETRLFVETLRKRKFPLGKGRWL